jgi:hypothetical protein
MPFVKGNQLAKNRTSSKNLLPLIRERVLKATNKRITLDNMLSKVSDVDLLKFAQSIMPKDINVDINKTNVVYITNTPRPTACIDTTATEALPIIGKTPPCDSATNKALSDDSKPVNSIVPDANTTLHTDSIAHDVTHIVNANIVASTLEDDDV